MKLLAALLTILLLAAGVLYLKQETLIKKATVLILEDATKLPVSVGSVDLKWSEHKVVGKDFRIEISEHDFLNAEQVELSFDLSNIAKRQINLPLIHIFGFSTECPLTDCTLVRMIEELARKSDTPPFIKASVGEIKADNFVRGIFRKEEFSIHLKPESLLVSLADGKERITSKGDVKVEWNAPPALSSIKSFSGSVNVDGKLEMPNVKLNLAQLTPEPDKILIAASLIDGIFEARPSYSGKDGEIGGAISYNLASTMLSAKDLAVKHLPLKAFVESLGSAKLNFSAEGEMSLAKFTGEMKSDVNVTELPLPGLESASASITANAKQISVQNLELSGDRGVIRGNLEGVPQKFKGRIELPKLKLKEIERPGIETNIYFLSSGMDLSGSVDALSVSGPVIFTKFRHRMGDDAGREELRVEGLVDLSGKPTELSTVKGTITLKPLSVKQEETTISFDRPVSLVLKNEEITVPETKLLIGDHSALLAGAISKEKGYNLSLRGTASLMPLLAGISAIEDVRGGLNIGLALTGPLEEPILNGKITLADGEMSIPFGKESVNLAEINGVIEFSDSDLNIRSLSNGSGDGKIEISGGVSNFLSKEKRQGNITWTIRRLQGEPVSGFTARVNGNGVLEFVGENRPKLTGEIRFPELSYEQRTDLQTLIASLFDLVLSRKTIKAGRSTGSVGTVPIDLDIGIKARRSIIIDTDLAQGEFSSDLKLLTLDSKPVLSGRIFGDSGELILGKAEFEVTEALLLFNNTPLGASPEVTFRAEGELGARGSEELMQINIEGELPDPKISITSETGRNQRELLSLLGISFERFAETRSSNQLSLSDILNPFSGVGFFDRVTGLTGVTDVDIDSGYSADTGEFAPKVRATRPLPYDMSLVAEAELTQFSRTNIRAEYSLTEHSSIFAGWRNAPSTKDPENLTGSFGVGVNYRERFEGTSLYPKELILENLQGLAP